MAGHIGQRDPTGRLLDAAATGDVEGVRDALAAGADATYTNEFGFDALGSALWESHPDVALVLVDAGAEVHLDAAAALGAIGVLDAEWSGPPPVGEAIGPFLLACRNGQVGSIGWFLERGLPVDMHPPGTEWGGIGCPGLHHAAVNGHVGAVVALLAAGADPTLVDDVHGSRALAWAASGGHGDVVEILAAKGEIGHRNAEGLTAADLARSNGFPDLADELDAAARGHE